MFYAIYTSAEINRRVVHKNFGKFWKKNLYSKFHYDGKKQDDFGNTRWSSLPIINNRSSLNVTHITNKFENFH